MAVLLAGTCALGAHQAVPSAPGPSARYYWKTTSAGKTAQLLTLFCSGCETSSHHSQDIPLVTVLRDTIGDDYPSNDRVSYVWLLTYSRPGLGKRILSAVPFFYWRAGKGPPKASRRDEKPLLNLLTPRHSSVTSVLHTIVQWTLLDSAGLPTRASSRAYRTNQMDHERLHLEEAIGYLRLAPGSSAPDALTDQQLDLILARLELRKRVLGGFVSERRAAELGEEEGFYQERIRQRNWELLRFCADKTGLSFEPLDLAGARDRYAVLWYAPGRSRLPLGTSLGPIWKLLNIKDPYPSGEKLEAAPSYLRTVNGESGALVPLGVYGLDYPKQPLLLIDFRDASHLRWNEMTQRAINEITSGVIGVSRITNWYYFLGADLYSFYASRHGKAMSRAERLDSYSQFRVALALDRTLDSTLRADMQHRVESLAVNPLKTAPEKELEVAAIRYANLTSEAVDDKGRIMSKLNNDRRAEVAEFGASNNERVRDDVFHYLSLGLYTHRAHNTPGFLSQLDRKRRAEYDLAFLEQLASAGTDPEVTNRRSDIRQAVSELRQLTPELRAKQMRDRARRSIERVTDLSQDPQLKIWQAQGLRVAGSRDALR